jgi:hypothetical protein
MAFFAKIIRMYNIYSEVDGFNLLNHEKVMDCLNVCCRNYNKNFFNVET